MLFHMLKTHILPTLQLDSGAWLSGCPVAYQTWGRLNDEGTNAVLVCHALTGNTEVDDWWGNLLGPGRALDPEKYFVVAANVLGSPYGTVSPLTINPATGQRYGADFPRVTIRDTVRAHRQLLEALGVKQLVFAIGGSMGGMQVLEWGYEGEFVKGLVPIAVGGRHSAWCIGWSEVQRQAIFADPKWKEGRYPANDGPVSGLSVARMAAMISYRSGHSFQERFGRNASNDLFSVESYLNYQGKKLVERFDANCYVHLTWQMDSHDVSRGRGTYPDALKRLQQPALILGIPSDVLYTFPEQEELAHYIPSATLKTIHSDQGHDAFLIEVEAINAHVMDWLEAHKTYFFQSDKEAYCS